MSSLLSMLHDQSATGPVSGPASGGGNFKQLLSRSISDLDSAKAASDDPEDTAVIAQCLLQLHKLQAAEQKELHSALGMSAQQKLIAKHPQNPQNQGGGY